jgi:RNA polymerase sigma-70 factor (ECF subfamily)
MMNEEIQLVQKINNGDEAAFRRLFLFYYKRMLLYASGYIDDPFAAEDLVQDFFVDIWEKRERLVITSSVSSYFFAAIHNRCIQYLRKIKVRENYKQKQILKLREAEIMMNHSNDFTFSEMELNEIQKIITISLSKLPEKTQEIFKISRKVLLSNKEIADQLNISVKTVEYHISKSLSHLRSALGNLFP